MIEDFCYNTEELDEELQKNIGYENLSHNYLRPQKTNASPIILTSTEIIMQSPRTLCEIYRDKTRRIFTDNILSNNLISTALKIYSASLIEKRT